MSRRGPLHYFRIESDDLVAKLEAGLLAYEGGVEVLAELFRLAHTLKGSARVVRHGEVADLAHAMEDVLAHHRETSAPLSKQEVGELLRVVDAIRGALRGAESLPAPAGANGAAGRATEHVELGVLRIPLGDMDALAAGVLEAQGHAGLLRARVASLDELRRGVDAWVDRATSLGPVAGDPRATAALDDLVAKLAEHQRQLATLTDSLDVELRELAQRTATLRLVEVSAVFPELERAVFDAAATTDRSVRFVARGGEVKIDAQVLTPIRSALLQLVRNAVAHGIEDPAERHAGGKAATGTVEVAVERRGGRVAFLVKDDGRGIDRDGVRRAATTLAAPPDGRPVEAIAAEELIFRPGVTTAREVSELSGRGVGLDVVRDSVSRCKGGISVESIPGLGTRFDVVVPVSLSAIRGLTVVAAARTVLVPLDALESTRTIDEGAIAWSTDGQSLVEGDRAIPFRPLGPWLDPSARAEAPRVAVVVRTQAGLVALGVDAVRGTRDILVRTLPAGIGSPPGVAGATFDSHGDPELVLDPAGLSALPSGLDAPSTSGTRARRPILVIDDSLTTRMLEQSILEAAGYEVDVASSAEEGLAKASARAYGLMVVDVEMPGMNGYDLARETRGRDDLRAIPIIMVSSLASSESRARAREAGVSAYMVKGEFDQGSFLGLVADLLA